MEYFMKALGTLGSSAVMTPLTGWLSAITPYISSLPSMYVTSNIYISGPVFAFTASITAIIAAIYKVS